LRRACWSAIAPHDGSIGHELKRLEFHAFGVEGPEREADIVEAVVVEDAFGNWVRGLGAEVVDWRGVIVSQRSACLCYAYRR